MTPTECRYRSALRAIMNLDCSFNNWPRETAVKIAREVMEIDAEIKHRQRRLRSSSTNTKEKL